MMTILDEVANSSKYDSLELVEYYEWIARVALKYYQLRKEHGLHDAGTRQQGGWRQKMPIRVMAAMRCIGSLYM